MDDAYNQYVAEKAAEAASMRTMRTSVGTATSGIIQGHGGLVGATIGNVPTAEKALIATRERLEMLIECASKLTARLENIGDRAFGSVPQGGGDQTTAPVRSGDIGAIKDGLDALAEQIGRAHDAVTRLESL